MISFLFTRCFVAVALLLFFFFSAVQKGFTQNSRLRNDSVTVAVAPGYDSVGGFHRFWLGKGYRNLWAAPVRLKVFRILEEKGGLTPVEMGGSRQTKSLRLKDKSGKLWVLRSVQKYPEKGLPEKLRNTVAQRILQDQVITVHPFGALTVPPLADALGLAHTNPQIVFVPDDPALGSFRNEFANTVLLFEEKGAIDTFRTINTEVLQAKLEEGEAFAVKQKLVLRARLLDILIGDWDRHEGQWRWEEKAENGEKFYTPVPNDRDYVFYNTTGVLPWLVGSQQTTARFQGFDNDIRYIETYNFNSRFFDRYFLNGLSEKDWDDEIKQVQMTLTDGLLRNAVRRMPDTIFTLTGEDIVQTLIARRASLKERAMGYYRFLSRYVDVPGSAKEERFNIEHKADGFVQISIFNKVTSGEKLVYERTFDPAVTEEIRLYGMGGNDVFAVNGAANSGIKIRMIGGDGVDRFGVAGDNPNSRAMYIYDRKDEENIYPVRGARLRLKRDSSVNAFDRRNFRYNSSAPVINLFYNIDQRTFFSFGWAWVKQGFRKEPYASRHELIGGYSPVRGSFAFRYNADWRNVFGKYGINFNLLSIGPRNQSNFFGTGNNTVFSNNNRNGRRLSYYRNLYDIVTADLRLVRHTSPQVSWNVGLATQYYASNEEDNKTRFLSEYNRTNRNEAVFMNRVHAGVGAGLQIDTRSQGAMPVKGVLFSADLRAMQQMRGEKVSFGALRTDISLFTRISRDSGIVLVNRAGAGTTIGTPQFYQMMMLGGPLNLRGYNLNRFTGNSLLYHNAELRLKLFDFTSYLLPGSLGLIGFSDVGRVWLKDETSTTWHHGYGGGIYIVPANVVLIRALLGHSKEGNQFYFNFFYGL